MVAAGMPHRRGLGDLATDQRAETELGRLVLRGVLDETLGLAGETYLALWRGYVFSLAGPSELANASGHGFACDGCETVERRKWCRCSFRRRIYDEARAVLLLEGPRPASATHCMVIHDLPAELFDIWDIRHGLTALAVHFGLTPRKSMVLGNAASRFARPAP